MCSLRHKQCEDLRQKERSGPQNWPSQNFVLHVPFSELFFLFSNLFGFRILTNPKKNWFYLPPLPKLVGKRSFSCKEKFTAKTEFPHPPAVCSSESTISNKESIKDFSERKAFCTGRIHDSRNVGILAHSEKHCNDFLYMTIRRTHAEIEIFNCLWPSSQAFNAIWHSRVRKNHGITMGLMPFFEQGLGSVLFCCLSNVVVFAFIRVFCFTYPMSFAIWDERRMRGGCPYYKVLRFFYGKVWPGIQIETGEPMTHGVGRRELYSIKPINAIYSKLNNYFLCFKNIPKLKKK